MSCRAHIFVSAVTLLAAVSATHAQGFWQDYQPVEQLVSDRNVLSTSLRHLQVGLQRPTGFSEVYHAPGQPGMFMRQHGGIRAVFPQSLYLYNEDEDGMDAMIPPNTVFQIGPRISPDNTGMVPVHAPPQESGSQSNGGHDSINQVQARLMPEGYGPNASQPRRDYRSSTTVRDALIEPERQLSERDHDSGESQLYVSGTMLGDDAYRQSRLLQLMLQAADAE